MCDPVLAQYQQRWLTLVFLSNQNHLSVTSLESIHTNLHQNYMSQL